MLLVVERVRDKYLTKDNKSREGREGERGRKGRMEGGRKGGTEGRREAGLVYFALQFKGTHSS